MLYCCSPSEEHKDPNTIVKNDIPWSDEDTNVAHLTGDDFDQFVQQHNSVLVMFYAPCKLIDLFSRILFESLHCEKYTFIYPWF